MSGIEALAVGGLALGAVGTGIQAAAQLRAGQARSDALKANASIARQDAEITRIEGRRRERQLRREGRRIESRRRALVGASGLEDTGSFARVAMNNAVEEERDALAVRFGTQLTASRLEAQAENLRLGARDARRAGELGAISTLLSFAPGAAAMGSTFFAGSSSLPTVPTTPASRVGPGGRLAGPV